MATYHPEEKEYLRPDDMVERVSLPGDVADVFEEEQPFDQVWLWVIMGIETCVVFIPMLAMGIAWSIMVMVGFFLALTMAMLASLKLMTWIDRIGIHYRFKPFHRRERTIYWDEIDAAEVRKYDPIREYGGWGIRTMKKGNVAYNVKGGYGIQVKLKSGKKILIGTQNPEEASRHLVMRPLTV
jgi:hypothetical protein